MKKSLFIFAFAIVAASTLFSVNSCNSASKPASDTTVVDSTDTCNLDSALLDSTSVDSLKADSLKK
jgi:hypothetical protein